MSLKGKTLKAANFKFAGFNWGILELSGSTVDILNFEQPHQETNDYILVDIDLFDKSSRYMNHYAILVVRVNCLGVFKGYQKEGEILQCTPHNVWEGQDKEEWLTAIRTAIRTSP